LNLYISDQSCAPDVIIAQLVSNKKSLNDPWTPGLYLHNVWPQDISTGSLLHGQNYIKNWGKPKLITQEPLFTTLHIPSLAIAFFEYLLPSRG